MEGGNKHSNRAGNRGTETLGSHGGRARSLEGMENEFKEGGRGPAKVQDWTDKESIS